MGEIKVRSSLLPCGFRNQKMTSAMSEPTRQAQSLRFGGWARRQPPIPVTCWGTI